MNPLEQELALETQDLRNRVALANDLYLNEIAAALGCHRAFIVETIAVMKETIAEAENVKTAPHVATAEALAVFHRNKRIAMENVS